MKSTWSRWKQMISKKREKNWKEKCIEKLHRCLHGQIYSWIKSIWFVLPRHQASKIITEITRFGRAILFMSKEENSHFKTINCLAFLLCLTILPFWFRSSPMRQPMGPLQSPILTENTTKTTWFGWPFFLWAKGRTASLSDLSYPVTHLGWCLTYLSPQAPPPGPQSDINTTEIIWFGCIIFFMCKKESGHLMNL